MKLWIDTEGSSKWMKAMLGITNPSTDTPVFYLARDGDGVIGYDGCGAIDFDYSDLTHSIVEEGPRLATRSVAFLVDRQGETKIVMRRAVRPFDLFYDHEFNSLLISNAVYQDYQNWLRPCVSAISEVTCWFGKKTGQYYYGNLRNENSLKQCIWEKSCFALVDTSDFHINQTRIDREEVPLDNEVVYKGYDIVFAGLQEYYRGTPSLHKYIPTKLTFSFPYQDILNVGLGQTLISARLFEAIWKRKRPKSRVRGITGSRPLVRVRFDCKPTE